jgi:CheY-like chemotaxis protein
LLTILAIGEDPNLLKTRAEVLRKTGANVVCSRGANALTFMGKWEFDLIVLCHSIEARRANEIAKTAHKHGSRTLVMLLVSDAASEKKYDGIEVDAGISVEPDVLVHSTTEMLKKRTKPGLVRLPVNRSKPPKRKMPASCPADIAEQRVLRAG